MALPCRATLEDVNQTCVYLAGKPTGATLREIASVVGEKLADTRRLAALQAWGLVEAQDKGKFVVTDEGRRCTKSDIERIDVLRGVIRRIPAYLAIAERAALRKEDSLTNNDVAAHWHQHFKGEAKGSDQQLKMQTSCFFQIAEGAGLGTMVVGRRGGETRFSFNAQSLKEFVGATAGGNAEGALTPVHSAEAEPKGEAEGSAASPAAKREGGTTLAPPRKTGQGIFVAHGKNKKALEQLKKVLDQFRIPYKVATEEPNLGRPISAKVREVMESCNCAILVFTADEEFRTTKGESIWRPSENVVYELGASGFLYDNRLVIMKEDKVTFPTNFRDIGYISFEEDRLDAKAVDVLKELIGFGIVKVST